MQDPTIVDWQNLIVLGLVAAAGIYLARQAWATIARKKSGACGSCGSCPASTAADPKQVVQIGLLDKPSRTTAV